MLLDKFLSNFQIVFILFAVFHEPALAIKKVYVVYLGAHSHGPEPTSVDLHRVTTSHTDLLSSSLGSEEKAKDALIHSYEKHINGFSAFLEEEEAAEVAKQDGVVSVFLDEGKQLHTTHSWDFLMVEHNGLTRPSSIWKKARFGEDTIIANIDTGVWPESKSFSGEGYGPIPSRWKGFCQFNESAGPVCNRKLIGARYFIKGYEAYAGKQDPSLYNPRDNTGHGTHTLSTAGGNVVEGASIFGFGKGTIKGGSPRARVANYKVCWPPVNNNTCLEADILEAFDAAIHDGVDVISFSIGGSPTDYMYDSIAIGSLHAVANGIPVVCSGGNNGTAGYGTITNVAPWIFTVAASTIDRHFEANVLLKNGSFFKGVSLSIPLPSEGFYTLINSVDAAAANVSIDDARLCKSNSLDSAKVKGKIVVCLRGQNARVAKGIESLRAGASGMILCNDELSGAVLIEDAHFLPTAHITYTDGLILFAYLNSTKNPQGLITPPKGMLGVKPSPSMADFSSKGPNSITPEILKPDITAPGVDIIAAFSESASPSDIPEDKRSTPYYIMSGTSMSCPHVSGVVGLLRTLHPDWSPAAIKSAIMTTSRTRDNSLEPMRDSNNEEASAFWRGAGHIRPNRAMDPGLVYDMSPNDYYDFLCGIGYNQSSIAQMAAPLNYSCPKNFNILNLNYPSISVPYLNGSVVVTRKLKNVGRPGSYACRIKQPPFFRVSVEPKILKFEKMGEEKSFNVTLTAKGSAWGFRSGGVTWTDGIHYVRSPIVVANAYILVYAIYSAYIFILYSSYLAFLC